MTIFEIFEMLGVEGDTEHPYGWIDALIHNSTLDDEIKHEMESFNSEECPEEVMIIMLEQLLNNQFDRIASGMPFNQSDIHRKLNKL